MVTMDSFLYYLVHPLHNELLLKSIIHLKVSAQNTVKLHGTPCILLSKCRLKLLRISLKIRGKYMLFILMDFQTLNGNYEITLQEPPSSLLNKMLT